MSPHIKEQLIAGVLLMAAGIGLGIFATKRIITGPPQA